MSDPLPPFVPVLKEDDAHLTDKQRRYVDNIARGMDSFPAAKSAGYGDSYARVIATRTKKNPVVAKAIEEIRKKGCDMAAYRPVEAMSEAKSAEEFARKHKNPMAVVKATELRSKLSGLLIDHIQIVTVDLTGALQAARTRVFPGTASQSEQAEPKQGTTPPEHNGRDPYRNPSWD